LISYIAHNIAEPLAAVITISFSQDVFPDTLKIAKIAPIFQSSGKLLINNYRPVSVLSVF